MNAACFVIVLLCISVHLFGNEITHSSKTEVFGLEKFLDFNFF